MTNAKTMAAKVLKNAVKKVAVSNANSACGYIFYQPKMPKSVKELRKF